MLIRLYSDGCSDVEICRALKLTQKQFEKREKDDDDFAQLVEYGRLCSKAWWLDLGRKAAKAGANSQAFQFWYANMKNRFGWTDKAEGNDTNAAQNKSIDEIAERIRQINSKIAKTPANAELTRLLEGRNG
jgi:hypothetical protein